MPLTRDQLCELKSAADVIIKQLFKDETFLKTITDSVSNEIMKNLKQQLSSFEKKVETLEADINVLTEANKKVVKNLNDKIDLLNAKTSDCTGLSYNPLQIISEITEIKQRENNLLVFGILESALDSDAVKDVIRTVVPDFEMTGSKTYRLAQLNYVRNNNNRLQELVTCPAETRCVVQHNDDPIVPIDLQHPGLTVQLSISTGNVKNFVSSVKRYILLTFLIELCAVFVTDFQRNFQFT
ncbi:hypothetical protein JTB14_032936 [Gonioctena quinquepunctata]|nr:hypothetical protein JTB14_032936 [Gonioctena quinquepunctata]